MVAKTLHSTSHGVFDYQQCVPDGYRNNWQVKSDKSLIAALEWRDDRGGAQFWLTPDEQKYPALAIRVSGDLADVHYFPQEGHPGFRGRDGHGLPDGGLTITTSGRDDHAISCTLVPRWLPGSLWMRRPSVE